MVTEVVKAAASKLEMDTLPFETPQNMFAHAQAMLKAPDVSSNSLFFGVEFSRDNKNYTLRVLSGMSGGPLVDPQSGESSTSVDCRPEGQQYSLVDGKASYEGHYSIANPDKQQQLQSHLPSPCPSNTYLTSGFLALQLALDEAMLQQKEGSNAPLNVQFRPLPRPEFSENFASQAFWMRALMCVYVVLAVSAPVRWLITFIVEEKENKIKEGMLMMGLHYSVFWCSWGLTYLGVYACSCALCTAVMTFSGLLTQSSPVLVFLLLLSFGLSLIPYSFAVSTFISNIRSGGPMASFLVSIMSMPFMLLTYNPSLVSISGLWWCC